MHATRPAVRSLPVILALAWWAHPPVPAAARSDTTPPALVSFSIVPGTIDTSTGRQLIAFTAHLTDDASGVKSAGAGTVSHVQLRSQGGHYALARFDAAHRIVGTATDGVYRDVVTLPRGSDTGRWAVTVLRLVDQAGNSRTLNSAQLQAKGFQASFSNTSGSGRLLSVTRGGPASGTVTSWPVGIECPPSCATEFHAGSTVTLLAAPSPASRFTGWQGACAAVSGPWCHLTMTAHRWAQANFAPNVETLTVSTNGQGVVRSTPAGISCPPTCSHDFLIGTAVHLAGSPAAGWHFLSWSGACNGSAACSVMMSAPRTVSAVFQPDTAPLGSAFTNYVASRSDRVGVAIYDTHTGTTWTLNPDGRFQTASIVKVQIMGTVLHRAQVQGRGLTPFEQQNLVPMIEQSDNNAATNLWNSVGGASGVAAFDRLAGLTNTTPNVAWGLTTTTAPDNVRLVRDYAFGSTALDPQWRAYGLNLMEHVVSWQRWGVSAGATPGTTVALKNGWLPLNDSAVWRINSIGWISGHGRNYVIAVLTDHNSSMQYGVDTIEAIARMAWNTFGS
jgi:List-Bact-rpt repeat protein/beta-lactamase family protein